MARKEFLVVIAEGGPCDGQRLFSAPLSDRTLSVGRSTAADIVLPAAESAIGQLHCDLRVQGREIWLEPRPHQEVYVDGGPQGGGNARLVTASERILPETDHPFRLIELGGLARTPDRSASAFAQTRLRVMVARKSAPRVRTPQKIRARRNEDNAKREIGAIQGVLVSFVGASIALAIYGAIFVAPAFADVLKRLGWIQTGVEQVGRDVVDDLAGLLSTVERQHGQTVDQLAALPEKLRSPQPDYYNTVSPDIWLAGYVDEDELFHGLGTAWTVAGQYQGRRALITNKHVVDLLLENQKEGRPAIRRFDGEGKLMQLFLDASLFEQAGFVHPLYKKLDEMADTSKGTTVINVADIGRVVLADPGADASLGAGLQLADSASLLKLGEADAVGYVGFPFENLEAGAPSVEEPRPMYIAGAIARVSGPMKSVGDVRDRQLLMLDAVAAGGASGSPVFDTSGKVIGVIAGGDVVHLDAGIMRSGTDRLADVSRSELRVPVGFTYAIRADVVRELLDGAVDTARPDRWRQTLHEVGAEASAETAKFAQWKAMYCKGAEPSRLTIPGATEIGANGVFEHRTSPGTDDQTSIYLSVQTLNGGRLGKADILLEADDHIAPPLDATAFHLSHSLLVQRANDIRLAVTGTPGAAIVVDQFTCPPPPRATESTR